MLRSETTPSRKNRNKTLQRDSLIWATSFKINMPTTIGEESKPKCKTEQLTQLITLDDRLRDHRAIRSNKVNRSTKRLEKSTCSIAS